MRATSPRFLTHLIKDQKLNLNLEDEIVRETLLTRGGEIVQARVREFLKLPALAKQTDVESALAFEPEER